MIRGQETAAKEKSFYQEEEITDKETVSPVDIAGSGQTNGDETAEKEGANKLIEDGCVLISQHADSMGAPTACETAGVPNVSYNGSTASACPNTFLVSSRVNWEPYFEYAMNCVADGTQIDADWTGTLATGSVELSSLGSAVADGTQEAIDAAAGILEQQIH